jgi:hypothetical protein
MERVIDWPGPDGLGYVNLHWTKDGKWRGRPFKTVEEFMAYTQWMTIKPQVADDIYFCLTKQSQTGPTLKGTKGNVVTALRNAANAMSSRALWFDIDIKAPPKGYKTVDEVLIAIDAFCAQANLPGPSALVHSGGGVHVYWFFETAQDMAVWKPIALGLKAEAQRLGLRADYGVTPDPARVLRVPGTFNRKQENNPRPVRLLHLGPDYPVERFQHLEPIGRPLMPVTAAVTALQKPPPFDLSAFEGQMMHPEFSMLNPMADVLAGDHKDRRDLPLDPTPMIKMCPHFEDVFKTGGAGLPQGLWMLDVLASTWMENGRTFAQEFSKGYSSYDPDEVDRMFDRKTVDKAARDLGWPSCQAFENEGCKQCAGCNLKGTINSPLKLCNKIDPDPPTPVAFQPAAAPLDLLLPPGYTVKDGFIVCVVDKFDKEGAALAPDIWQLFHVKIVGRPWCSADNHLHFTYEDKHHTVEVAVPFKLAGSEMALASFLADKGVMPQFDKMVRTFMRSWISHIRELQRSEVTAPYGWVEDETGSIRGFAYGGYLFKADGTTERTTNSEKVLEAAYTPKGDPQVMVDMVKHVCDVQHAPLQIMSLQPWASPLLYVTGENATVVWGWSPNAGTGKTTALRTGMALWSNPKKSGENGFSTVVGLELKMNSLKNLPIVIDELLREEDIDKMIPAFQMVSQGESGQRGKRDRTLAEHPDWKCTLVCGSNQSMHERQLIKGGASDASMKRVFEVCVDPGPVQAHAATMTAVARRRDDLNSNYGMIGLAYAKYLAEHRESIKARGIQIEADFRKHVKVTNSERFWLAACTTTLLAAELANTILAQPLYQVDLIRQYLINTYRAQQQWVEENVQISGTFMQSEDILEQFLEAFTNHQLATDKLHTGKGAPGLFETFTVPAANSARGNICAIHWAIEARVVHIHLGKFKQWIKEELPPNTATGNGVVNALKRSMKAKQLDRVDMLAGTKLPISQGRVAVLEIPVTEDTFLHTIMERFVKAAPASSVSAAFEAQDEYGGVQSALQAGIAQSAKDHALLAGITGLTGATGPAGGAP